MLKLSLIYLLELALVSTLSTKVMTNFPRYLYRYRPLSDEAQVARELDAIQKSYLWFSLFSELNDPAELANAEVKKFPFATDLSLRLILNDTKGEFAKVMNNRAKYLATSWLDKEKSGVCCFSEREDHQAMWAYYAGNFSGICIKYDTYKLLSLSRFCWGNKPIKVTYSDQRIVTAENTMDFGSKTSEDIKALSTKHFDWKHEEEWRLLKKDSFGKVYHTENAIDKIILGPKTLSEASERLKNLCKERGINIFEVAFDTHLMRVKPIKIKAQTKKMQIASFNDKAKAQCKSILLKGYDKKSLELAIKTAREYPNAKSVFFVGLVNEFRSLRIIILFELADGSEDTKKIEFKIIGKKFDVDFNYSF